MSATAKLMRELAGMIEGNAENDPDTTGERNAEAYRRADAIEALADAWERVDLDDRDLMLTAITRTRIKDSAASETEPLAGDHKPKDGTP